MVVVTPHSSLLWSLYLDPKQTREVRANRGGLEVAGRAGVGQPQPQCQAPTTPSPISVITGGPKRHSFLSVLLQVLYPNTPSACSYLRTGKCHFSSPKEATTPIATRPRGNNDVFHRYTIDSCMNKLSSSVHRLRRPNKTL